jgi:hypothetical protein
MSAVASSALLILGFGPLARALQGEASGAITYQLPICRCVAPADKRGVSRITYCGFITRLSKVLRKANKALDPLCNTTVLRFAG